MDTAGVFRGGEAVRNCLREMAGTTGLEPATYAVTGQRSNQLNYVPREGKTSCKSTELYRISSGMHNRCDSAYSILMLIVSNRK